MSTSLRAHDFIIESTNKTELRGLINEVFSQHSYYFESYEPNPVILDLGAHVGVATLYFKKLYPEARITAVEPHPQVFALLKQNLANNAIYDVKTVNAAVAVRPGRTELHADQKDDWFSTASFSAGAWNKTQTTAPLTVLAITLSELITEPIDLLKMDIEGAEYEVLLAAGAELDLVKRIIVEFHPDTYKSKQKLIDHLVKRGFKVIKGEGKADRPFQLEVLEFERLI